MYDIVLGPLIPRVEVYPVVNLTFNNFNLTMRCLPHSKDLRYEWRKKDSTLPSRTLAAHSSYLTIVNLKPEDAGDYQCIVSNSTGKVISEFSTVEIKGDYNYVYKCVR